MRSGILKRGAFSLIEVTLALGVCAFCFVAIFGLLPVGLKSKQAATEQTAANGILSMIAADLRATPQTTPPGLAAKTKQFGINVPANPVTAEESLAELYIGGDGLFSASLKTDSRYKVVVSSVENTTAASVVNRVASLIKIKVSWPAAAGVGEPAGSVQTILALDRN